jgi:hypothetical protein
MKLAELKESLLESMCESLSKHLNRMDNSLYSGKMGVAIFLYTYAEFSNSEKYNELADELILKIVSSKEYKNGGLALGLCGIGWGLSHLATNRFIEIDDKFLTNNFNMPIIGYYPRNIDLFHGQIGKGIYLCNRLHQLQHQKESPETTVLTIDIIRIINEMDIYKESWMEELRMYHFHEIENLFKVGEIPHYYHILRDTAQSTIFFYKVYKLNIYPNVTRILLNDSITKIEFCLRLIEDHYYTRINSGKHGYLLDGIILELAYALWITSETSSDIYNRFNQAYVETHITKMFKKGVKIRGGSYLFYLIRLTQSLTRIYHRTQKESLKEFSDNLITSIISPFINDKNMFEMDLFEKYNEDNTWQGDFGLAGISGVGMALISSKSDKYLSWDEAIGLS